MNRREALKKFYNIIIAVGASSFFSFEDLLALDLKQTNKPNLVWLQGSSCSGCSLSLTNIEDIPFIDFILEFVNIIYHPNISVLEGENVADLLNKAYVELKDNYILVVEGSIPTVLPHACLLADIPFVEWVEKMSKNSQNCIGVGTCASFGGITDMQGIETGALPLTKIINQAGINKPLINYFC